jgi:hypothetical protein
MNVKYACIHFVCNFCDRNARAASVSKVEATQQTGFVTVDYSLREAGAFTLPANISHSGHA